VKIISEQADNGLMSLLLKDSNKKAETMRMMKLTIARGAL
jgi:hypothetical protein